MGALPATQHRWGGGRYTVAGERSTRAGVSICCMNAIAQPQIDNRRHARFLYWTGWRVCDIADYLNENAKTIHSWKDRDAWDRADTVERVGGALEARLVQLILKDPKTGGDFKEIDLLHRQLERQARIQRYQGGGTETDLNPNIAARNAGPKKAPTRNELSEEQIEQLVDAFREGCFDYQLDWNGAGNMRTRMILKSRQIGATYYFAREALIDAITTGRNQIFLSASKAQAHQFKTYMQAFLNDVVGVKLTGDPIVLWNGAELHFLGTNYRTAQGRSGNFYFDEFFWDNLLARVTTLRFFDAILTAIISLFLEALMTSRLGLLVCLQIAF